MIKYTASFSNDEIVIYESDNGMASSKEGAILALINSYTEEIHNIEERIKAQEKHILYLKSLVPELMFEQRKVENRKKYV